jgi:hypothetical protein
MMSMECMVYGEYGVGGVWGVWSVWCMACLVLQEVGVSETHTFVTGRAGCEVCQWVYNSAEG